ncbi:MAG: DUF4258 domain-containing protein [Chloroflexota bacterium]
MAYTLTEHARSAMQKRGIRLAWLERALAEPGWREPDAVDCQLEHRLAIISEFGDRVLRVIVNTEADPERVVTMYFDRRLRGGR